MRALRRALVLLAGLPLLLAALPPGPARLVKDITPGQGSETWTYAPAIASGVVGDRLVFQGVDPGVSQLWSTDGTAEGTMILRDVAASRLTLFRGSLYFWGVNGGVGGLWKTDGTRTGTVLIREIGSDRASGFVVFRGDLYFTSDPDSRRFKLWKSDGTTEGTFLTADLELAYPSDLTVIGDHLFFVASLSGVWDKSFLYKTDGTESGTSLVREFTPAPYEGVCPGPCPSFPPTGFVDLGGIAYFLAYDRSAGTEMWRSDGTPAGTFRVSDLCPGVCDGGAPGGELAVVGGRIFFSGNDRIHGFEPWTSDGTAAGTRLIKDLKPGAEGSYPWTFLGVGSSVIFRADPDSSGYDYKLFATDGSDFGTVALTLQGVHWPLLSLAGVLYFPADRLPRGGLVGEKGWEIWRSDGTPGGTSLFHDGPDSFNTPIAEIGGRFFFGGFGSTRAALWKSGSSPEDASLVRVLGNRSASSNPFLMNDVGGTLLFSAFDENRADSLWTSDGSESGTTAIASLSRQAAGSDAYFGAVSAWFRDQLFFAAQQESRDGIWRTDGTAAGTQLVKEVGGPFGMTVVGGALFFSAWDPGHGAELWRSDGTTAGTVIVKDIEPGPDSSLPIHLTAHRGLLYFAAKVEGVEALWRSDGTEADTFPVASGMGEIAAISEFGDWLAFTTVKTVWRSDGTGAGTVPVANLQQVHSPPIAVGRNLYFAAAGMHGTELWRVDESFSGAVPVKVISPSNGDPRMVAVGSELFFSSTDGVHGWELWASDGTAAGTRMVKDIAAGSPSSSPEVLTEIGGILVFSARDEVHGREIWRSDGIEEGTWLVADVLPGAGSSSPYPFARSGSSLYFSADDRVNGRELWSIPLSSLDQPGRPPHTVPWRQ